MGRSETTYGFSPRRISPLAHVREVLFVCWHDCFSLGDPSRDDPLPRGNMQHQFPDAMASGNGPSRGSLSVDSVKNFRERRTVPGFAVE